MAGRCEHVLRLDRSPRASVELARAALDRVDADEVYVDGPVLVGRVADGVGPTREYVVDVGPLGDDTALSVAARYRGVGSTATPPWSLEQTLITAVEELAGPDVEFLPTLDQVDSADRADDHAAPAPGPDDDWAAVGEHGAVEETGRRSLGRPVYETTVDGRVVTAAVVRPEAGGAAPRVSVATPMRAARRGTGFEVRSEGDDLAQVAYDGAGTPPDLPETVRYRLAALDAVGRLVVDDRLATVTHVTETLADGEAFRAQARAVVAVARAVEAETDAGGHTGDGSADHGE